MFSITKKKVFFEHFSWAQNLFIENKKSSLLIFIYTVFIYYIRIIQSNRYSFREREREKKKRNNLINIYISTTIVMWVLFFNNLLFWVDGFSNHNATDNLNNNRIMDKTHVCVCVCDYSLFILRNINKNTLLFYFVFAFDIFES